MRQSYPKSLKEAVQTALELDSYHLASRVWGVKIDHSSESEGSST